MQPFKTGLGVLAFAFIAHICAAQPTANQPGAGPPPLVPPPPPQLASELEAKACSGTRWVGILKQGGNASCATLGFDHQRWEGSALFSGNPPGGIPPSLGRYCVIDSISEDYPPPSLIVNWDWDSELEALDKDCLAVGPAATQEEYYRGLGSQFYIEAGLTKQSAAGDSPVRLAVLDTGPTTGTPTEVRPQDPTVPCEATSQCSSHGFSLATLARRLLCGGPGQPDCNGVAITSQLALPRMAEHGGLSPRFETGGVAGYLSDIAQAIESEVEGWEQWKKDQQPRLILNLSIGWEPYFGGANVTSRGGRANVRAVYSALERAACKGALIIAAVGNFQGPPNLGASGAASAPDYYSAAIFPAGWQKRKVPAAVDGKDCIAPGAPLVHAVGGVDASGRLLPNARPLALPRLVAYGDHAVLGAYGTPILGTAVLTGTSVSTTVVAAAAAAVWSRSPSWSPVQVIEHLYNAGTPIPAPSGSCPTPPGTCMRSTQFPTAGVEVREVNMRAAVNALLATMPGASLLDAWKCNLPCGLTMPPGSWPDEVEIKPASVAVPVAPEICHNEHAESNAVKKDCPHWLYPTIEATPWGGPQPGPNPCMNCDVKRPTSPGALFVELYSPFNVGSIAATSITAQLIVGPDLTDVNWDANTTTGVYRYALPGLGFLSTNNKRVYCFSDALVEDFVTAYGDFSMIVSMLVTTTAGTYSTVSPVLRLPDTTVLTTGMCSMILEPEE